MAAVLYALWLVLLCGTVPSLAHTLGESPCTTNCTCCVNETCFEDGAYCEKDCDPGFYGINCTERCPSGCATCNRMFGTNSTCSACKAGFYGDTCQLNCSIGCKNSSCSKETAICSDECIEDYTGDKCCTKVGNCSKCASPSQCEVCNGKFFGDNCELCKVGHHGDSCNKECINCKGDKCDKTSGKCTEGCTGNFKRNKGVCNRCMPGYWSMMCDTKCPVNCNNSKCSLEKGTCYKCQMGWYDKFCNSSCPTNCKNQTCNKGDGTCSEGCRENFAGNKCDMCVNGKYGENCERKCQNCKDNICSKESGNCFWGCSGNFSGDDCTKCTDGIYGIECTKQCPRYCRDRVCDQSTGDCINGCINNTITGDKCCLHQKHGHCKTCSFNSSCLHCEPGYYGDTCTNSCSEGCVGHTCDKETGKCSDQCRAEYSGDKCCSRVGYCKLCENNTLCGECDDGFYGEQCDRNCSGNCADGKCLRKDGLCKDGCQNRYYGIYCNQTCPHKCENQICDKVSGSCTQGCVTGYSGDKCCLYLSHCKLCENNNMCAECLDGFYGEQCETPCPERCLGTCERGDGRCNRGCKNGLYGDNCKQSCPTNCKDKICDKLTGTCTHGCRLDQYSGDKCCLLNTYGQGYCKICSSDNDCVECKQGFYGQYCNEECSRNCNGSICERNTGTCSGRCYEGYTGDMCCLNGGHCQQCTSSSECKTCQTGYFGKYCNQTCSLGCLGTTCDKTWGHCSNGCRAGFTGDKCCQQNGFCNTCKSNDECEVCQSGYFGQTCHETCSIGCRVGTCDRKNGLCKCQEGYSGDKCCVNNKNCRVCSSTTQCSECKQTFYSNDCELSCPKNCLSDTCDKHTGTCRQCKKGYYGSTCKTKCPRNCYNDKCRMDGTCYTCNQGYYGPTCSTPCSSTCRNNNCSINGYCVSCKDGYYGRECDSLCHENCVTCVSETQCRKCKNGFYGENCRSSCPGNCVNCTHGRHCGSCKPGYYGDTCNTRCSLCKTGTACRQSDGYCLHACKDGYTSRYCRQTCGSKCRTCLRKYANSCTVCSEGRFGKWNKYYSQQYSYCDTKCSTRCLHGMCDERTGHCFNCTGSFHGDLCDTCLEPLANPDKECSCRTDVCLDARTCYRCRNITWYPDARSQSCCPCSNTCRNSTCSRENTCTHGCVDGYYGAGCKLKCSARQGGCEKCSLNDRNRYVCERCKQGLYPKRKQCTQCSYTCLNGTCDPTNGRCTDGCIEGRWSARCGRGCGQYCSGGICDRDSGHCTAGCVAGHWGKTCDSHCERNCINKTCDRFSGHCVDGCMNGYWGMFCNNSCGQQCVDDTCNRTNGHCIEGCENGYWGETCNGTCGRFCMNGSCDRSSGHCTEGCKNGHWGEVCNKACGQHCVNRTCDRMDGHCSEGCQNGHWDETCNKTCGRNCMNGTCDRIGGHCTEGCQIGHWGETCNGTCVKHCEVCEGDSECLRCEAGRYLTNCSGQCSRGCASVKGSLECELSDGSCIGGCSNGRLYGKQCDLGCSENCTGSECEWLTGECSRGCLSGLYGEFCNNTCAGTCLPVANETTCLDTNGTCIAGCLNGFYGETCRDECSIHCVNGSCDRDSGSCLHGCLQGHLGANCSIALAAKEPEGGVSPVTVAVLSALFLLFLLVVIAVLVIRKRRRPSQGRQLQRHVPRDNNDATVHESPVPLSDLHLDRAAANDDEVVYANTAGASMRIPVSGLLDYAVNMTKEDYADIFQTLPKGLIKPYEDSQKPENVPRNRYKTIWPYDFSRVRLEGGRNDYINASFIDGYLRRKEYIAALGPLARTTENFAIFWQMIWEQNVEKIVMLTNLQEPSGMKCEQYWPDVGATVNYDVISVFGRNDDVYADYLIRHLIVTKGDETREVYHLHYTAWPDKTIPDDVISLLDFRHVTSGLPSKLRGPTVVHCSAGIGRTGTYIGLDNLCRQTELQEAVDVYDCVVAMRENRTGMVQTAEQYMFLHRALAVYVTLGYQPIKSECFSEYVSVLDDARLCSMFTNLEACQSLTDVETAAIDRNKQLGNNSACADSPGDKYRVRLRLERQLGASSDYVNAVYLNSYAATNQYIVAQTPVHGGIENFLAMLLQERCSVIVDLDSVTSFANHGWTSALGNKRSSKINNFQLSVSQMTTSQKFLQRQLRISLGGQTAVKELVVSHYQFKDWAEDTAVPDSPEDFVEFIRDVETAVRKSPESGPILIHCGTAGGRSCLFYVVAMAIQKLETEHDLSMIGIVHQARTRRRLAIANKEQLLFCYKCVDAYLQTFETYSNFVA